MPVAVVTGASQGLGLALARGLAENGWRVVGDARGADLLARSFTTLTGTGHAAVPGDVTDPAHRETLTAAAARAGGADLLVNNASTLGASPLPTFADFDADTFRRLLEVNLVAPLALTRAFLPQLRRRRGTVVNITSDAAIEPYETWGGYGASKAALEHASRIVAAEEPTLTVYAVDPGDLRTAMHQAAFPGEDISDRPAPDSVVPALLGLLGSGLPSGRYRAADLAFAPPVSA